MERAVGACVALAAAGVASSQEQNYQPVPAFRSQQGYVEVHTGLSYTDNALLASAASDKVSDTLSSTGFDIDYARRGSKLDLDAHGGVDWVEYLKHTYNGAAYGTVNGSALWGHSTDLLQWVARDTFGQLTANPLAAATPTNLENVNYFTTGPTLNFGFGTDARLSLYGLYSNTTYQKSPFDSHSLTEGISLAHGLSASSSVSLNANTQRTEFTNRTVATNYDVRSAFFSYNTAIARTRMTADAGYASLHFGGTTSGGPLLTLQLDRRISYASTVYVRAQSEYSTAAASLRTGIGTTAAIGTFAGVSAAEPFKQRTVGLGWNFDHARTTFSFLASAEQQRYGQETTLDRNGTVLEAVLVRRLRPTVSATLSLRRSSEKYQHQDANIVETKLSAGLSKTFSKLGLSLRYDRHHRAASGTSSDLLTDYDENRLGVYLTYDVAGHRFAP